MKTKNRNPCLIAGNEQFESNLLRLMFNLHIKRQLNLDLKFKSISKTSKNIL